MKNYILPNITFGILSNTRTKRRRMAHHSWKSVQKKATTGFSSKLVHVSMLSVGIGLYVLSLLWPILTVSMSWFALMIDILGIALILISLSLIWKRPRPKINLN